MPKHRPYKSASSSRNPPEDDGLFFWTLIILLLAGFAIASWLGSFYVFGHPEKSFSYSILNKLGKLDPPKRYELTAAPRGQFLDAEKLFERYGMMPPQQLALENAKLLRSYIRNYEQHKDLITYITGNFVVTGVFRLSQENLFSSGIVVLARSTEKPEVLLELVFPATKEESVTLERILTAGLEITLAKTLDLTALINVRVMPDGRLNLTAVPLLYGSYTSSGTAGTASLEPPESLNVGAGLPILNQTAIASAEKHFETARTRPNFPKDHSLMRVQRTEAVKPDSIPVAKAIPVESSASKLPTVAEASAGTSETLDGVPVARALPANSNADIPVARAIPVSADVPEAAPAATPENALPTPPPTPLPTPTPPPSSTPTPTPAAAEMPTTELQPFSTAASGSIAPAPTSASTNASPAPASTPVQAAPASAGGSWQVYEAGRMPRGRLVDVSSARSIANAPAENSYLSGDFSVTASGPGRAILRSRRGNNNVRIIVDYPSGTSAPNEGETVRRDGSRPFQITSVEQAPDGQVNVHVREVTRP